MHFGARGLCFCSSVREVVRRAALVSRLHEADPSFLLGLWGHVGLCVQGSLCQLALGAGTGSPSLIPPPCPRRSHSQAWSLGERG